MIEASKQFGPLDQENIYSYEFSKIIILSCTEIESIFKIVGNLFGEECDNIADYKRMMWIHYPNIVNSYVYIPRLYKDIFPFEKWDKQCLSWWNAYTNLKYNRNKYLKDATFHNAIYSLSALHILILYLKEIYDIKDFINNYSDYIKSNYSQQTSYIDAKEDLPDFTKNEKDS